LLRDGISLTAFVITDVLFVINAIELTSGAKQMNTVTRIASVVVLAGGALLAGCVSHDDLAMVRTIAVTADQKADLAGQKAAQADQRAGMAQQRAEQAGQLAASASQEAQQAQALANTANSTANYAKGATDSLQSALTAHAAATAQNAYPSSPPRRVARGERG
jgi:hypothetical protein